MAERTKGSLIPHRRTSKCPTPRPIGIFWQILGFIDCTESHILRLNFYIQTRQLQVFAGLDTPILVASNGQIAGKNSDFERFNLAYDQWQSFYKFKRSSSTNDYIIPNLKLFVKGILDFGKGCIL